MVDGWCPTGAERDAPAARCARSRLTAVRGTDANGTPRRMSEILQPTSAADRLEVLDVLRGVALFGVFLMNMIGFCGPGVMATEGQLLSLRTAALDTVVYEVAFWLFSDKANSLFAFLFGLGFYLQLQRAEARGSDFTSIYTRRLTALLLFGLAHMFLVWSWDILHLYALTGFVLLALRRVSDRALLIGGILLMLFDWRIPQELLEQAGLGQWHGQPSVYSDEAVLTRQAVSNSGDYFEAVRLMARYTVFDYLLSGALFGWVIYASGRFMIGAWVGRRGWLTRASQCLPGFRATMLLALPAGLLLDGLARWLLWQVTSYGVPRIEHWHILHRVLHLLAVPLLTAGYVSAIVVAFHTKRGRRLLSPFAYTGRMALSNYVAQSFVYAFLVFGIGPGLALAGRIGSSAAVLIVITGYALQIAISRWWLSRFRFGPLEWLWRAVTYRSWPPMPRAASNDASL